MTTQKIIQALIEAFMISVSFMFFILIMIILSIAFFFSVKEIFLFIVRNKKNNLFKKNRIKDFSKISEEPKVK